MKPNDSIPVLSFNLKDSRSGAYEFMRKRLKFRGGIDTTVKDNRVRGKYK
jgi:hypothetical protein